MKLLLFSLLTLGFSLAAGCAPPVPPPPTTPPPQAAPAPVQPAATAATIGESLGSPTTPVIPDDAAWTIYCLTIQTPTHIPDSDRLKAQLIRHTHLNGWYVLHAEGKSTLFYGFYKDIKDAAAQADRHTVEHLQDDTGSTPFSACALVPLSSPDPDAPPQWDLRNASGYWSLQIAAYKGSPDRKKFAVDAVRQARAMGIDAYYYHTAAISSVFIGSWPRSAIKEQDQSVAESNDPNATIIVVPQPLPAGTNTDNLTTKDGHPAHVVAPRVEVVDATLLAAMKQYPNNAVNGEVLSHPIQTAHGPIMEPDPSFLVVIPHDNAQQ